MRAPIRKPSTFQISTQTLFPTLLHICDEFLTADQLKSLVGAAKDKVDVDDDALKAAVIDFGLGALAAECVDLERYDAVELSEIWFNVLQIGEHHWDHTHANHVLSGVIYLSDGCFTIFGDPRPAASVLALNYKDPRPGNVRSFIHRGKKNSIVAFPSWLPHRVATTHVARTTIAFNLMLRGPYGGAHSREQINF